MMKRFVGLILLPFSMFACVLAAALLFADPVTFSEWGKPPFLVKLPVSALLWIGFLCSVAGALVSLAYFGGGAVSARKLSGVLVLPLLLAGCVETRPASATVRPDGTRVGVSRQVIFMRAYDQTDAIHVAADNAEITVIDSVYHKRRPRWAGSTYFTTVTGK